MDKQNASSDGGFLFAKIFLTAGGKNLKIVVNYL